MAACNPEQHQQLPQQDPTKKHVLPSEPVSMMMGSPAASTSTLAPNSPWSAAASPPATTPLSTTADARLGGAANERNHRLGTPSALHGGYARGPMPGLGSLKEVSGTHPANFYPLDDRSRGLHTSSSTPSIGKASQAGSAAFDTDGESRLRQASSVARMDCHFLKEAFSRLKNSMEDETRERFRMQDSPLQSAFARRLDAVSDEALLGAVRSAAESEGHQPPADLSSMRMQVKELQEQISASRRAAAAQERQAQHAIEALERRLAAHEGTPQGYLHPGQQYHVHGFQLPNSPYMAGGSPGAGHYQDYAPAWAAEISTPAEVQQANLEAQVAELTQAIADLKANKDRRTSSVRRSSELHHLLNNEKQIWQSSAGELGTRIQDVQELVRGEAVLREEVDVRLRDDIREIRQQLMDMQRYMDAAAQSQLPPAMSPPSGAYSSKAPSAAEEQPVEPRRSFPAKQADELYQLEQQMATVQQSMSEQRHHLPAEAAPVLDQQLGHLAAVVRDMQTPVPELVIPQVPKDEVGSASVLSDACLAPKIAEIAQQQQRDFEAYSSEDDSLPPSARAALGSARRPKVVPPPSSVPSLALPINASSQRKDLSDSEVVESPIAPVPEEQLAEEQEALEAAQAQEAEAAVAAAQAAVAAVAAAAAAAETAEAEVPEAVEAAEGANAPEQQGGQGEEGEEEDIEEVQRDIPTAPEAVVVLNGQQPSAEHHAVVSMAIPTLALPATIQMPETIPVLDSTPASTAIATVTTVPPPSPMPVAGSNEVLPPQSTPRLAEPILGEDELDNAEACSHGEDHEEPEHDVGPAVAVAQPGRFQFFPKCLPQCFAGVGRRGARSRTPKPAAAATKDGEEQSASKQDPRSASRGRNPRQMQALTAAVQAATGRRSMQPTASKEAPASSALVAIPPKRKSFAEVRALVPASAELANLAPEDRAATEKELEEHAATFIQSMLRGYKTRQATKDELEVAQTRRKSAAILIQSMQRCRIARRASQGGGYGPEVVACGRIEGRQRGSKIILERAVVEVEQEGVSPDAAGNTGELQNAPHIASVKVGDTDAAVRIQSAFRGRNARLSIRALQQAPKDDVVDLMTSVQNDFDFIQKRFNNKKEAAPSSSSAPKALVYAAPKEWAGEDSDSDDLDEAEAERRALQSYHRRETRLSLATPVPIEMAEVVPPAVYAEQKEWGGAGDSDESSEEDADAERQALESFKRRETRLSLAPAALAEVPAAAAAAAAVVDQEKEWGGLETDSDSSEEADADRLALESFKRRETRLSLAPRPVEETPEAPQKNSEEAGHGLRRTKAKVFGGNIWAVVENAATTLQSAVRGHQARKKYRSMVEERKSDKAAKRVSWEAGLSASLLGKEPSLELLQKSFSEAIEEALRPLKGIRLLEGPQDDFCQLCGCVKPCVSTAVNTEVEIPHRCDGGTDTSDLLLSSLPSTLRSLPSDSLGKAESSSLATATATAATATAATSTEAEAAPPVGPRPTTVSACSSISAAPAPAPPALSDDKKLEGLVLKLQSIQRGRAVRSSIHELESAGVCMLSLPGHLNDSPDASPRPAEAEEEEEEDASEGEEESGSEYYDEESEEEEREEDKAVTHSELVEEAGHCIEDIRSNARRMMIEDEQ